MTALRHDKSTGQQASQSGNYLAQQDINDPSSSSRRGVRPGPDEVDWPGRRLAAGSRPTHGSSAMPQSQYPIGSAIPAHMSPSGAQAGSSVELDSFGGSMDRDSTLQPPTVRRDLPARYSFRSNQPQNTQGNPSSPSATRSSTQYPNDFAGSQSDDVIGSVPTSTRDSSTPTSGKTPGAMQNEVGQPAERKQSLGRRLHNYIIKQSGNGGFRTDTNFQESTTRERAYGNIHQSKRKRKFPHYYQPARVAAVDNTNNIHHDRLKRRHAGPLDERYHSPRDSRLNELVVQCTQEIYDYTAAGRHANGDGDVPWRRTFIRHASPLLLRLSNWVLGRPHNGQLTGGETFGLCMRWLAGVIALLTVMLVPVTATGHIRNGGKYDPLLYRYWKYPVQAKNWYEDASRWSEPASMSKASALKRSPYRRAQPPGTIQRLLVPEYLCFLEEPMPLKYDDEGNRLDFDGHNVAAWKNEHRTDTPITYVFISYVLGHFNTPEKRDFLHAVGRRAAEDAGISAYWVSCSCLGSTKADGDLNVWRICDVIRISHSVVVALPESLVDDSEHVTTDHLLGAWTSRVWTLPELLLVPGNNEVKIFREGNSFDFPERRHRRQFAPFSTDTGSAGALIDHYEGSLVLSPLQLVIIALRCLHSHGKAQYLPGDLTYALMGLLRQRPTVNPDDSGFQAFARLSLANDSNQLLERLVCILPISPDQDWFHMDDQWGVSLWDIEPTTQVCGVCDNDTVIVDGAHAAVIRWKSFALVRWLERKTWKRTLLGFGLRLSPFIFLFGLILCGLGSAYGPAATAFGVFFILLSLLFLIPAPYIIRILYGGKIWGAQPWLFGFEGHLDIKTIERFIFGIESRHLSWSAAGSPLSRHRPDEYGNCIGRDPAEDEEVQHRIRNSIRARMGEERIFTLVDTGTMTVTIFSAVRPPVAAIVCGEEGGMKRAVLCSYDWTTQTFYRETVLRMESPVFDSMDPLGRVRLGLRRLDRGFTPVLHA